MIHEAALAFWILNPGKLKPLGSPSPETEFICSEVYTRSWNGVKLFQSNPSQTSKWAKLMEEVILNSTACYYCISWDHCKLGSWLDIYLYENVEVSVKEGAKTMQERCLSKCLIEVFVAFYSISCSGLGIVSSLFRYSYFYLKWAQVG